MRIRLRARSLWLALAAAALSLEAGRAVAAEWQALDATSEGLFGSGAASVLDDGSMVFGFASVAPGGGSEAYTPVRWLRQPDGSFAAEALGEGATPLDLPRGTAVDASADGSAAALRGLPRWTEANGIECGPFCPPENENVAITADGSRIAATSFASAPPGRRVLLWSDAGVEVIDEVPSFGGLNVWDLAPDGTVAAGEYPGAGGAEPALWRRVAPNVWTRTLPGLPPGAVVARASHVSDDGRFAIVQWSPTGYASIGSNAILWSEEEGWEDVGAAACQPDVVDGDGSDVIGRCGTRLGRWTRDLGWEVFDDVPAFVAQDVSADGRYVVGGGCSTNCGRFADLGPAPAPAPECGNGIDDDGDGRTDFPSDPGCASATDLSEKAPTLPCDDGADNDGDALVDFPADPVCTGPGFDRESAQCQDGVDNDGDGRIDFDGGASHNGGVAIAAPDPQCANTPFRNRERQGACGLGFEAAPALVWLALRRRRQGAGRR